MNLWAWIGRAAAVQLFVLAGCVPTVMMPTVSPTPGPGKLPADFAADHAACTARANQQVAPAAQAANNQVAGTALLNVMTGAGDNAAALNAQATTAVQQQYNNAYLACMYAKGNDAPGYPPHPTYYAEPTEPVPTHRARRRVAHKPSPTAPATASAPTSEPTSGAGFVVPAASAAPAAGSGFVEPAPSASSAAAGSPTGQPASASANGFAVPPPAH